jgi:hypothetical protein
VIGAVNSIVRRGLVTPLFEEEEGLTIEVGERLLLAGRLTSAASKSARST